MKSVNMIIFVYPKSFFAVALLGALTQAQSLSAKVAAITNDCCGPKNLACSCTQDQKVYSK